MKTKWSTKKSAELRTRAEAALRKPGVESKRRVNPKKTGADTARLLQELQLHQVELEMQNTELQATRDHTDALLEKYTDLYDFAPVGYFSLDEKGRILEANLTGAALLGVDRARLINRSLPHFVTSTSLPDFQAFLKQICSGTKKHVCEAALQKQNGTRFWVSFNGVSVLPGKNPLKSCRVAVSDITSRKQAEDAQQRVEALASVNRELEKELVQRRSAEEALRKKEHYQSQLLAQSDLMQAQFRELSRQILCTQEDERKRISRELHDVIAQTLTGINLRLASLQKGALLNPKGLEADIAATQRLVEHAVDIVHQFARELRPAVLDDLGLIPALHSFMKNFTERTGVRTSLTAFAAVEQMDTDKRTILFRIAQEALTNVARHAKATRVDLTIQELPEFICMKIKDDGKSFRVEDTLLANKGKRLGLLGMRERLEMVGGNFGIESAPGKGTTVRAQIPRGKARATVKPRSLTPAKQLL